MFFTQIFKRTHVKAAIVLTYREIGIFWLKMIIPSKSHTYSDIAKNIYYFIG